MAMEIIFPEDISVRIMCSRYFPPISEVDQQQLREWYESLLNVNRFPITFRNIQELREWYESLVLNVNRFPITFRNIENNKDIRRPVYRWSKRCYQDVFVRGFFAHNQENTPDNIFYNLHLHVNEGGAPLVGKHLSTIFISTSDRAEWKPYVRVVGEEQIYFHYRIYSPGGISVKDSLTRYKFPNQAEIAFVGGIASEFIESCTEYRVSNRGREMNYECQRILIKNRKFRMDEFILEGGEFDDFDETIEWGEE